MFLLITLESLHIYSLDIELGRGYSSIEGHCSGTPGAGILDQLGLSWIGNVNGKSSPVALCGPIFYPHKRSSLSMAYQQYGHRLLLKILDTLANEMTKKGEVESESGKSVRKVNCKRRGEIGPMTGCHVLHTKKPLQQFFTGKQ